jgi:hypothetical protein
VSFSFTFTLLSSHYCPILYSEYWKKMKPKHSREWEENQQQPDTFWVTSFEPQFDLTLLLFFFHSVFFLNIRKIYVFLIPIHMISSQISWMKSCVFFFYWTIIMFVWSFVVICDGQATLRMKTFILECVKIEMISNFFLYLL